MADTQHFCLRWNNYQSSITSAFENLRDDEDFVDVTLACDGKSLKAHRVVLSACSPYFRELLKSTPCKHPVIVLQDVAFADLHALVEFIYHGEVNVHQRNLSSFLKTAEVLRVSGLTQQADDKDEVSHHNLSSRGNHQNFSDKLNEDALFTSPPSPPPPPNATSGGATVNQLLRRAAAAALLSSSGRRERRNSTEQLDSSLEQTQSIAPSKRARTSNIENHSNSETTSNNQVTPTDFSSAPFPSKQSQNSGRKVDDGGASCGSSPSPTAMLDGVKSEPVELMCTAPDGDNSNESAEGEAPAEQDDHDGTQAAPFMSTPDSKLFASTTSAGSLNFSMAAFADPSGLSGIGTQALQGNSDSSAGTSTQELSGRGWVLGQPFCPICRKSFTRAWSLQRHMADTHFYVPQSFECDVCGRSYRSRNSLVSHKSQYHGGRAVLKETGDTDVVSVKQEHKESG